MSDEGQVIRGINWRETFPFTNIFRAFRVAIHPSKLMLGLALLLGLYVGGRVLDALWPGRSRAVPNEIGLFEGVAPRAHGGAAMLGGLPAEGNAAANAANFTDARTAARDAVESDYANRLVEMKLTTDTNIAKDWARTGSKLGDLEDAYIKRRDDSLKQLKSDPTEGYDKQMSAPNLKDADKKKITDEYNANIKEMYDRTADEIRAAHKIKGEGLFDTFINYEINQVTNVVYGVAGANWFGDTGVIGSVRDFLMVGPVWLIHYHTVYFILFAILFLAVWSIFGGAISRIAAVHVARDEKISVRQALNFAVGKFLSFGSAPVIPLLIVLVVGLVVTVTAVVLGNIPYVGPILVGALYILALVAGFVMTLVMLGTAGGFNLMYPTVAVEGSDSFDAISRSFSYVYARPWRMLFYTVVAVIYGAACYLFVHMFLWLMLVLTHTFTSAGMFAHTASGRELLPTMWPSPATTGRLTYLIDTTQLNWGQATGAYLMSFWIYLTVALLGAFAISFYFSANTIIYYLMRNEVDATELDDVYVEQSDEDFGESAPVSASSTSAPAPAVTPVTSTVVTPVSSTESTGTPPAESTPI